MPLQQKGAGPKILVEHVLSKNRSSRGSAAGDLRCAGGTTSQKKFQLTLPKELKRPASEPIVMQRSHNIGSTRAIVVRGLSIEEKYLNLI